jgi:hypothetical protein
LASHWERELRAIEEDAEAEPFVGLLASDVDCPVCPATIGQDCQ